MARVSEQRPEVAQHVGVPVQRHRGSGQQFGVISDWARSVSLMCNGPAPTGEWGGSEYAWQLLSLGCRTANRPNHDGAGGGVAADARPVRPTLPLRNTTTTR